MQRKRRQCFQRYYFHAEMILLNRNDIHKRIETLNKHVTLMMFLFIIVNSVFLFILPSAFANIDYFCILTLLSCGHMWVFMKCMGSILQEKSELEKMLKKLDHPEDEPDSEDNDK
jgi:hypothetical protein